MNLGGIKISSAELETVLNQVAGIRETAAVAVSVSGGPEELVVFAVAESPLDEQQTMAEMNRLLKEKLNPLFRDSTGRHRRRLTADRQQQSHAPPAARSIAEPRTGAIPLSIY